MVALIRSPSRTYLDPWTGQLFGEGGLEGNLRPKLDPNARIGGVEGGVIMSKLGNETAKYVKVSPVSERTFTYFH
jgi:FAD-linked sulfhydryl oxidase